MASSPRDPPLFDLPRIQAAPFLRQIDFHTELGSTNDRAAELAKIATVQTPALVLAERQTSGRGRGQNIWWSSAGALTFSLLMDSMVVMPRARRVPLLAPAAGLGICRAVSELAPSHQVQVKWPNDVYLEGGKLAGVLIEAISGRSKRLVIGVGINVNNSLSTAGPELLRTATSLCDVTGRMHDLTDVLVCILHHLAGSLEQARDQVDQLPHDWQAFCMLQGRRVCVQEAGGRETEGTCQGIDDEGALILQTPSGRTRVFSGTVARIG